MLRKIDTNIWVDEQPLKFWQLEIGTRMTIIRLSSGELIVISPIQVDEKTIQEINEIGNVGFIIAPNLFHHLFVSEFKDIYPEAKLWIAPGLELKRADLKSDRIMNEGEKTIWEEIEYLLFEGFQAMVDFRGPLKVNEFIFFHKESRSLILTDTAFNFDRTFPLRTRLASQAIGSYKKLRPSFLEKIATQEKEQVKNSVQKILNWDFERVIMAHGSIVENDGKRKFKEGYEWFLGTSF